MTQTPERTVADTQASWLAKQLGISPAVAERFLYSPQDRCPEARLRIQRDSAGAYIQATVDLPTHDVLQLCHYTAAPQRRPVSLTRQLLQRRPQPRHHTSQFVEFSGYSNADLGPGIEHFRCIISETIMDNDAFRAYAERWGEVKLVSTANANLAILKGMEDPYRYLAELKDPSVKRSKWRRMLP